MNFKITLQITKQNGIVPTVLPVKTIVVKRCEFSELTEPRNG